MGFLDKVKEQSTALAAKAQEGVSRGRRSSTTDRRRRRKPTRSFATSVRGSGRSGTAATTARATPRSNVSSASSRRSKRSTARSRCRWCCHREASSTWSRSTTRPHPHPRRSRPPQRRPARGCHAASAPRPPRRLRARGRPPPPAAAPPPPAAAPPPPPAACRLRPRLRRPLPRPRPRHHPPQRRRVGSASTTSDRSDHRFGRAAGSDDAVGRPPKRWSTVGGGPLSEVPVTLTAHDDQGRGVRGSGADGRGGVPGRRGRPRPRAGGRGRPESRWRRPAPGDRRRRQPHHRALARCHGAAPASRWRSTSRRWSPPAATSAGVPITGFTPSSARRASPPTTWQPSRRRSRAATASSRPTSRSARSS